MTKFDKGMEKLYQKSDIQLSFLLFALKIEMIAYWKTIRKKYIQ